MTSKRCVWSGASPPLMEIAYVDLLDDGLEARGTQLGVAYELRYELTGSQLRAALVEGASIEIELGDHDFFDLGYSPLFNALPVRRDRLLQEAEARDYVMAWVDVPSLDVRRSEQRYEALGGNRVRFSSGSFVADLELDDDGLVVSYPGLAERLA